MPKLKSKGSGVPGGFRYFQQETQTLIKAPHWWELVRAVTRHRDSNRIPLGQLEVEVETWLAGEVMKEAPYLVDVENPVPAEPVGGLRRAASWGWSDVARFTVTMIDNFFTGNKRVPQDEANRRAKICSTCPANVPMAQCNSGCNGLQSALATAVKKITGGATPYDDRLQACQFCGCINRAQIWFPLEILQKHTSSEIQAALPPHCWKGQDSTVATMKLSVPPLPENPKPKGGEPQVAKPTIKAKGGGKGKK